MSGLVLKLDPHERVLINGAVIENGDRRTKFCVVSPGANILRLRDAIHPDDANTPVKRVCYVTQLVLSGDADTAEAKRQIVRGIEQLSQVFKDDDSRSILATATEAVVAEQYYQCLKALRGLVPREARLLAHADA